MRSINKAEGGKIGALRQALSVLSMNPHVSTRLKKNMLEDPIDNVLYAARESGMPDADVQALHQQLQTNVDAQKLPASLAERLVAIHTRAMRTPEDLYIHKPIQTLPGPLKPGQYGMGELENKPWDEILKDSEAQPGPVVPVHYSMGGKVVRKAGGGKVRAAQDLSKALENWKVNKLPQRGFFSTLDELIANSPEEVMPAYIWQKYLKPGQMLKRGDMEFPLKKEEIEYANLGNMHRFGAGISGEPGDADMRWTRDQVRDYVRRHRPDIRTDLNISQQQMDHLSHPSTKHSSSGQENFIEQRGLRGSHDEDPYLGDARYSGMGLSHDSQIPAYEESVTKGPDFANFKSHFGPKDISWSRSTRHPLDDGTMRLVEEIQSDRHSAAAERPSQLARWGQPMQEAPQRRGYRTPEQEQLMREWEGPMIKPGETMGARNIRAQAYEAAQNAPPDAPFKSPQDYGTLELRKQLLDAVNSNDRYLGIVSGADQTARYGINDDPRRVKGMQEMYDQVYPSVLRKLAQKYGSDVKPLKADISTGEHFRPATFRDYDLENQHDIFPTVGNLAAGERYYWGKDANDFVKSLIKDYQEVIPGNMHVIEAQRNLDRLNNLHEKGGITESKADQMKTLISDHLQKAHGFWLDHVSSLEDSSAFSNVRSETKTFPAMELTPEVLDRIKRIGVPLWSIGAGAVGLNALSPADQPAGPGFALGGLADRLTALTRSPEQNARVENLKATANQGLASGQVSPDEFAQLQGVFQRYGEGDSSPLDLGSVDALRNLRAAVSNG